MTIRFTVPGEPTGKGRPRFVRATGRTYTPAGTVAYESLVRLCAADAAQGRRFASDAGLAIRLTCYFSIPKSTGKGRARDMRDGLVGARKKPDADNVLKAVADALNSVLYKDDAQIVRAEVVKRYDDGKGPRVDVEITD